MEAENNSSDDSNHDSSSRKRKRSGGTEKALDRISSLPSPILVHILSLLPTKYAAGTSVLSKPWQYLWTFTPIIDFHDCRDIRYYKGSYKDLSSFVSCINRSLLLNQSPKIENFRVVMYYKKALASDVDVWLRFLTMKNVKELDLNFSAEVHSNDYSSTDDDETDDDDDDDETCRYLLPMNMFSNYSSLETLKLRNCEIHHGRLIHCKSLKVLSLSRMLLNDSFLSDMLLSACPSLELLELLDCSNYDWLDIKSERLRKLVISKSDIPPVYNNDDKPPTVIDAPYLQSLDISGFLYEYNIIDSLSLVDVKLNFHPSDSSDLNENHDDSLVGLLENLRHVKDLTVGSWCLQILSMLEEKAMPCPHSSSVCLTVDTSLCERELPGITKLLRHTPLIETLIINTSSISLHLMNSETEFLNSCDLGGENYWSSWKSTFALALLNLKTVRIIGFGATKSEVELLFFLLKNASMLGKMIIHARKTTNVSLEKSLVVAQRLLSFPRCSQDAVVIFA